MTNEFPKGVKCRKKLFQKISPKIDLSELTDLKESLNTTTCRFIPFTKFLSPCVWQPII